MADFAWFASQAGPGNFMCSHCYEYLSLDETWTDEDGQKWDVCMPCKAHEDEELRSKEI